MTLAAITFDCWGTLLDSAHDLASERVGQLVNQLPSSDGPSVAGAYRHALERYREIEGLGFSLGAASVLSMTLDALGASLSPRAFDTTVRDWEEALLRLPPPVLDDALGVLAALRRQGVRIALISDTGLTPGRVMRLVLDRVGLLQHIEWCAFSNELGVTKHQPQPFVATLYALGIAPETALHVGDTCATDITGAKRVGMRAAWRRPLGANAECAAADITLSSLQELIQVAAWHT